MICPECKKNAKTIETRKNQDGSIRQRFECQRLHRFTFVDGVILTPEAKRARKGASLKKIYDARIKRKAERLAMTEIVDYAMPMMNIERLMRKIHDQCLDGDYANAEVEATLLIVEARVLLNSLKVMQE